MSSSQPYLQSSPLASTGRLKKSKFTYRHLNHLASASPTCPLRVIAHIDLDAFYAQCEMVRLGVPPDMPLAVQQWQGLIAINYPARKHGMNRHITSAEARKICPDIILQHVATWKEGDEKWAYHEDSFKNMATHKVSLDPYRMESRKILATIKEALPPAPVQKVEKASVDEVFLDLSTQIHSIMLERYPELEGPPPYDDPTELLPRPPTTALDWAADALVDLDEAETEEEDPDWDDIALLIGSEIVRSVRAAIYEKLRYTCSAGLSRNKMIAKLGSGYKKPDQQTVVRNRAVQQFLSSFKFTKIRNLGGKLGEEAVAMFDTDTVEGLLKIPIEQLKRLGDDTGTWLYGVIRGEDNSEVNPRTQIKSMLSAKSFRPSINTFEQGIRWLRIFVADIFSRCVEEGVLENKRRPRTINLHHRTGGQTRSKQAPIPQGRPMSEGVLFDLAKNLLAQTVAEGRAWPCANLSLSVGGFEEGVTGNRGIGGFLVRGDEAKAMLASEKSDYGHQIIERRHGKKRLKIEKPNIQTFFDRSSSRDSPSGAAEDDEYQEEAQSPDHERPIVDDTDIAHDSGSKPAEADYYTHDNAIENDDNDELYEQPLPETDDPDKEPSPTPPDSNPPPSSLPYRSPSPPPKKHKPRQQNIDLYFCKRCNAHQPLNDQAEHLDWHVAVDLSKDLQEADRQTAQAEAGSSVPQKRPDQVEAGSSVPQERPAPPMKPPAPRGRGRPPGSSRIQTAGSVKGQTKLAFGKG